MNKHQKRAATKEKTVFALENKEFICRYGLIAKKSMSKTRIRKELNLTTAQFNELEKEYLRLFYGKQ